MLTLCPRVAPRVGINADEVQRADSYAGFFEDFAPAGRFDRLTDIDEPAGKREAAFDRLALAAYEKDASLIVEDDAVGRERGCLR